MERFLNALLIAGTDPHVGKTVLTTALIAYWQTYCRNRRLGLLKPIDSNHDEPELYDRLLEMNPSTEAASPVSIAAVLPTPIAEREGRKGELEQAWQAFQTSSQQQDFVLLETQGGFGDPITRETTIADLAWDWRLPTVLVVPVRRGAIGQAVAHVALAQRGRVHLKGIVLNCIEPDSEAAIADWSSPTLIQSLTQKPVLGWIPYLHDRADLTKLAQVASNLDLERLLPL